MIAVLRNKLPLNSLWKVVGLVIALQWPVLADLNHDHMIMKGLHQNKRFAYRVHS